MKKRVTMNTKGISWLLCGMGALFLLLGGGICLIFNIEGVFSWSEAIFFNVIFFGLFGAVGIAMIVGGVVLLRRISKKDKLKQRLIGEGNYVWAEIMEVSQSHDIRINGRSPYVMRCCYGHYDGNTYIFKSEYLRFDPYLLLKEGKVKVWLDRENIKNYYVDIEGSSEFNIIEL